MKKILLSISALAALILSASAQRTTATTATTSATSFGVHAGGNMFTVNGKSSNGTDLDYNLNTGFSGGVNVNLPLGTGGTYLQPGISFVQKGAEYANNAKTTLNYIDIPLNILYRPALGNGHLVLGGGPYLGIGVGGKYKAPNGTRTRVEFGDEFDLTQATVPQFSRTDAGANLVAGYEFANKLSLNLKAQLGLKDISVKPSNSTNDQSELKNTGFGLSLGYRF